jgi:integrase
MLTIQKKHTKKGIVQYWFLRWHGQDGKYHGKSLGRCDQLSEREAKKALRLKENKFEQNPGHRNISKSMSIVDFTGRFFDARKGELAPGTILKYQEAVSYLTEFFGEHKTIDTLTKYDAERFKTAMQTGELKKGKKAMSPESVNMHLRSVKAIFNWGVEFEFLAVNPFRKSVMTIKNCSGWHYVSQKEFAAILEKASPKLALLMSLCRLAGLRRGEALSLVWQDVDFEKNHIVISGKEDWTPKDKEARTIPICPELSAMFLQAYETAPEGASKVLSDICHDNIPRDVKAIVKRAGLSMYGKPLHTLRKSCLTDWAGRFPMHTVKEWAGHSDIATTQKFYLKVSDGDYTKAAKESFWKKPESTENGTENGKNEENEPQEQNKKAL